MDPQSTTNDALENPTMSPDFIAGYLKGQIGKMVKVEFLIGNATTDRTGVLVKVGVSYIIIRPFDTNGVMLCDLYSIKFVTIVDRPNTPMFGVPGMGGM